ncbi:rhodanese-like domain-containing protein [Candidatus Neomicrothrix sp.]|uniref:Rhodanese-like domain-containing protein n=1 Tax=Candidatus Neomicrothrix subdominans TaxID=2954438 RepID=A0A936NCE7_9ACTN|nr:rhodanese-like domain-containing protein [Candidatus Microthrix sp.]MBK9297099.1 rhodanese-like domain-containing protein [Candidatus Microthrix subdominans]MBK6309112.1 rhodanese-like domain-containing protein [Candidatus Microthrix sp.]MBK6440168.1 rhodanese-like domain-containing protein [Candidatus Microthrix sp.]MBK6970457.1 rhodanese-like domain-containing protein [Candidatus Microthrix sp.]MBK7163932.1 rhodanese-like domain-containing protein [Candidatus Microthrix sp.]
MNRPSPIRAVLASLALLVAGPALAGCSGDEAADAATPGAEGSNAPAPGREAAGVALDADRIVIDVRTPEEFDAGHVNDARLIDIQGPDFDAQIAELDPDADYVVYCRSGNRSAVAAGEMRAIGLDVLDGGAMDDMTAAGWPAG